jgi:hypothetical protein
MIIPVAMSSGWSMANLRLPSALALLLALTSCFVPGQIWFPTLEGHVVDAQTGEPVSNVEVFAEYSSAGYPPGTPYFQGSATTDGAGAFLIPGRFGNFVNPLGSGFSEQPGFYAYHRDYGVAHIDWPDPHPAWSWRDVRFAIPSGSVEHEIRPGSSRVGQLVRPRRVRGPSIVPAAVRARVRAGHQMPAWGLLMSGGTDCGMRSLRSLSRPTSGGT